MVTGPHCHIGIKVNNVWKDPAKYVTFDYSAHSGIVWGEKPYGQAYRTTITFSVDEIQNPVADASVHWFIDGQDKGAIDTCTVKEAKATFTVQAKYMKGNIVLAESETETVNVKTGFFARLKAFFRALFGRLPKVVQEYLGVEIIDRVLP